MRAITPKEERRCSPLSRDPPLLLWLVCTLLLFCVFWKAHTGPPHTRRAGPSKQGLTPRRRTVATVAVHKKLVHYMLALMRLCLLTASTLLQGTSNTPSSLVMAPKKKRKEPPAAGGGASGSRAPPKKAPPTTADAAVASASVSDDAATVRGIVGRADRDALELVVLEAIEGKWLDDGVGTLRALLPVELQRARGAPAPAAVPTDMILDDTSSTFGQMDAETTLLILTSLNLRDQLTSVIAVCRGWRALRNTAQSPLFRELNLLLDLETHLSVAFRDPAFSSKERVVAGCLTHPIKGHTRPLKIAGWRAEVSIAEVNSFVHLSISSRTTE